jgi:effector-binding domain-containing protein
MLAEVEKLASGALHSYEVRTKELAAHQVLSIRTRARLRDLGDQGPRAFGEIIAHLGRAQAQAAGPVFALYHGPEFDEEAVDVEWCVPVDRPVCGKGHLSGRELPGGTVAYTLHAGPYEAVGPNAYAALQSWIQEHGHESDGPSREVFLVGPCQASESAAYRTELQWPIC